MTSEELAQLKGVIHDTISETTKIATDEVKAAIETHSQGDDHRYIQTMRSKEKRKTDNIERLKGNFVFYLLVTVTGGIGLAVWQYLKRAVSG